MVRWLPKRAVFADKEGFMEVGLSHFFCYVFSHKIHWKLTLVYLELKVAQEKGVERNYAIFIPKIDSQPF